MQISRLFSIVYILLGRRHVTARELAERFEVSVRTIYRDVEALSQAGVPVYATQGAGGGIHISEAYVLNKSALTDAEQGQILMALQSLSATGNDESDALLSRLAGLFNKDSADWIEVDFSRWGNEAHDRQVLAMLKDGILHRRQLRFIYHGSYGKRTERTVYPVKLIYKSRAWYLQAFCLERQDFRTFKAVRMADIQLLDDTFDRQKLPVPPPLESGESPQEAVATRPTPITFRFQPQIAWRVFDEFDPSLIQWNSDGTLTVEVGFFEDSWLYSYTFSFGDAVEILAPAHVRETMRGMLEKMTAQYRDT
ncbi:YafY family transcriptional regulator [Eubacteriales bacterium OttesenSCG-928-A19]|nr:YafY family transcriptional regulator [Eubacteriales bacterium OttesenSCG-928-A19]